VRADTRDVHTRDTPHRSCTAQPSSNAAHSTSCGMRPAWAARDDAACHGGVERRIRGSAAACATPCARDKVQAAARAHALQGDGVAPRTLAAAKRPAQMLWHTYNI
jgi:hypothetical protein